MGFLSCFSCASSEKQSVLHFRNPANNVGNSPLCCISSVNLRQFIGCAVREFTFLAKKPGCGGLLITTDACWGRCETWEKPVLESPFIESYQRVCTYNMTRMASVKLPNCKPNIDPIYTYPVALRCACGFCLTSTTECITSV
uniref:Glycoprotein hormone beta-5 n=1 Tax=Poecilia latipinna TaxID=48699 RepID=A0A3B3UKW7_9TELE